MGRKERKHLRRQILKNWPDIQKGIDKVIQNAIDRGETPEAAQAIMDGDECWSLVLGIDKERPSKAPITQEMIDVFREVYAEKKAKGN